MEKRHVESEFDCYQLLKILEEIVIKDNICLNGLPIGISIDDSFTDVFRIANGISLRSDGKGKYLLVICCKE